MMKEMTVRPAAIADVPAIAALHLRVWRDTYRDLVSAELFAIMDEAFRRTRWQNTLARPGLHQRVVVAEEDGRLVGLGACGASDLAIFGGRGEIRSLYVDPDYKRRGIGRLLLRHLADSLADNGYSGAALGVVVGNDPAMAFYRSLGGRPIGQYTDPGPTWRSENIAFVWDDLAMLRGVG